MPQPGVTRQKTSRSGQYSHPFAQGLAVPLHGVPEDMHHHERHGVLPPADRGRDRHPRGCAAVQPCHRPSLANQPGYLAHLPGHPALEAIPALPRGLRHHLTHPQIHLVLQTRPRCNVPHPRLTALLPSSRSGSPNPAARAARHPAPGMTDASAVQRPAGRTASPPAAGKCRLNFLYST